MKAITVAKTLATTAVACLALAGARGVTLDVGLTDPYAVGDVIHGVQAGGQVNRDVLMVNNLISLAPGTTSSTFVNDSGDLYQRSANVFGSLPTATSGGAVMASGIADGGAYLDITLGTSFVYLVAAYDGPNGGVQVWDIAGLAAGTTLQVPRYAQPIGPNSSLQSSYRYLMTGWTLLNPSGGSVPDGGTTALMLGTALIGLGVLKRRLTGTSLAHASKRA